MYGRRRYFRSSGGTFRQMKVEVKGSESEGERGIGTPVKARPWVVAMGIWSAGESMKIEGSRVVEGMLLLRVSASGDSSRSRRMRW